MKTEGRNAVLELLKTDKTIEKILLERGAQGSLGRIFAMAREKGVRVQFVAKEALDRESREKRHQGVIAFTTDYEYADLYDILSEKESSLIILCDGIEDVHNLGSILRVAECAGADGVVIPKARGASVTEAVVRIYLGGRRRAHEGRKGRLSERRHRNAEKPRLLGVRPRGGRREHLRLRLKGQSRPRRGRGGQRRQAPHARNVR